MLRVVTEYLIALLELLEAEGRTLRKRLFELVSGLILVLVASILLLAALGLLVWALYLALVLVMPQPLAALLCGLALLVIAGGIWWNARQRAG